MMKIIGLLSALSVTFGGDSQSPEGMICAYEVKVANAKGLPDKDEDTWSWFSSTPNYNDPYCEVIGFAKGSDAGKFKSVRTHTISESETPQWDETFVFANNEPECGGEGSEYDRIQFKLYDDDTIGGWTAFGLCNPDFLGETQVVYLSDVVSCDKEYAMELSVSEGGSLFVVMTKTAACCASSSSSSSSSSSGGGSSSSGGSSSGGSYSEPKKDETEDMKKLEEEKKIIEEEIKYEEKKEEEEEKMKEEEAVESTKGKGGGGGGKSKRMRRLLHQ